jgi:hypothetical protein
MSAETSNDLSKVDSHVDEPRKATAEEVKKGHRRASSMAADVYNIVDLGKLFRWRQGGRKSGDVGLTDGQKKRRRRLRLLLRRRN